MSNAKLCVWCVCSSVSHAPIFFRFSLPRSFNPKKLYCYNRFCSMLQYSKNFHNVCSTMQYALCALCYPCSVFSVQPPIWMSFPDFLQHFHDVSIFFFFLLLFRENSAVVIWVITLKLNVFCFRISDAYATYLHTQFSITSKAQHITRIARTHELMTWWNNVEGLYVISPKNY